MVRPRRALHAPLRIRIARVVAPTVAASALVSGVWIAQRPAESLTAVPAPVASPARVAELPERGIRVPARSRPTPSPPSTEKSETPRRKAAASDGEAKERSAKKASKQPKAKPKPKAKPQAERKVERKAKAPKKRAQQAEPAARTRQEKPADQPAEVVGTRYVEDEVNVRRAPDPESASVEVLEPASEVKVTGTVRDGWRQVRYDGQARWIKDSYLAKDEPAEEKPADDEPARDEKARDSGPSSGSCPSGSEVESGLTANAVAVHRALCHRFPQISSFGGRRADSGFHGSGRAVDAMISDSSVGWEIARYVRSNAGRLGVSEVIYAQKIWTVQRGGEGWRSMSDRGSVSANHYDHVHISVYGGSAS